MDVRADFLCNPITPLRIPVRASTYLSFIIDQASIMTHEPRSGAYRLLDDSSIDRIGTARGLEAFLDRALRTIYVIHGVAATIEYETELQRPRGERSSRLRDTLPRPGVLIWSGRGDEAHLDLVIARTDAPRWAARALVEAFENSAAIDGYTRVRAESFLPERALRRFGYERVPHSFDEATGEWSYEKRLAE